MTVETITIEIDCHSYPWHIVDAEYPECGPDNLIRMAEQYGVLMAFLPDHDMADWAYWYRITGPREHIVRLLVDEYAGDRATAEDLVGAYEVQPA